MNSHVINQEAINYGILYLLVYNIGDTSPHPERDSTNTELVLIAEHGLDQRRDEHQARVQISPPLGLNAVRVHVVY